jgi:hypothetical protein
MRVPEASSLRARTVVAAVVGFVFAHLPPRDRPDRVAPGGFEAASQDATVKNNAASQAHDREGVITRTPPV